MPECFRTDWPGAGALAACLLSIHAVIEFWRPGAQALLGAFFVCKAPFHALSKFIGAGGETLRFANHLRMFFDLHAALRNSRRGKSKNQQYNDRKHGVPR